MLTDSISSLLSSSCFVSVMVAILKLFALHGDLKHFDVR
jgi:hypothetical protein